MGEVQKSIKQGDRELFVGETVLINRAGTLVVSNEVKCKGNGVMNRKVVVQQNLQSLKAKM